MQLNFSQMPFDQATARLPAFVQSLLVCLPEDARARATELRMRAGGALAVTLPEGPLFFCNGRATPLWQEDCARLTSEQLSQILRALCEYSVHSFTQDIARGFITLPGGHRAGICGTAVCDDSSHAVSAVRDVSSISLRIAREIPGAAKPLCDKLFSENRLPNVLISGPPGSGKTTVLRDLALRLSAGLCGGYRRVAVVDERGELAGARGGAACCGVGPNTDVLTGYPKNQGILLAIRSLSPEVILCDELGGQEDAAALEAGHGAGVRFVATIHAGSWEEALARPVMQKLLEIDIFHALVHLPGIGQPMEIRNLNQRSKDFMLC